MADQIGLLFAWMDSAELEELRRQVQYGLASIPTIKEADDEYSEQ